MLHEYLNNRSSLSNIFNECIFRAFFYIHSFVRLASQKSGKLWTAIRDNCLPSCYVNYIVKNSYFSYREKNSNPSMSSYTSKIRVNSVAILTLPWRNPRFRQTLFWRASHCRLFKDKKRFRKRSNKIKTESDLLINTPLLHRGFVLGCLYPKVACKISYLAFLWSKNPNARVYFPVCHLSSVQGCFSFALLKEKT